MNPNTIDQFRQKALAVGYTQKEVEAEIQRKMQEAAQYSLLEQGVLDPSKVASSDPIVAARYVDTYGYNPQEQLTDDQKKAQGKGQSLLNSLDYLEGLYNQTQARGPVAGRIANLAGKVSGGNLAQQEYLFNETVEGLVAPLARVISGETGQLNQQDIERARGFLPRKGDSTSTALKKIAGARYLITTQSGTSASPASRATTSPSLPNQQGVSTAQDLTPQIQEQPNQRRQSDVDAENRTNTIMNIAKGIGSIFPGITNFGVSAVRGEQKAKDLGDAFLPLYAARRAKSIAPVAGEVGAFVLPGAVGPIAGGATKAARVATGALRGATAGASISTGRAIGQQKNLVEIGQEALSGAFTGGIIGGAFAGGAEAIKGLGGTIKRTGEGLIQSQYTVPRTGAGALNPRETIQELSRYGFRNINSVAEAAPKVTGDQGLITKLTREAVVKSQPVDPSGLLQIADDVAKDPAMPLGQDTKFYDFIKKGIQGLYQTKSTGAYSAAQSQYLDPSKTFDFIQALEKKAAGITRGRAPYAIQQQDLALAGAYRSMAEELRLRLFSEAGGDKIAVEFARNAQILAQAKKISPQLAIDLSKIKTVADLRSLAAPFVRGSQIVNSTEQSRNMFTNTIGGAATGIGRLFQNPLNMLAVPLSQPAPNAFLGGLLQKGGEAVQRGIPTDLLTKLLLLSKK